MAKKLYITLSMNGGKDEKVLGINDPEQALTRETVQAAVGVFMETKAFDFNGNAVDGFKSAEYKETVVDVIE